MDIFNIQSLITKGKLAKAKDTNAENAYVQLGMYQEGNRKLAASNGNAYAPYAMSLEEVKKLILDSDCGQQLEFKVGSIGPKVSFRKPTGANAIDVIIPGALEITRGNVGGIYNAAIEPDYNNSSPANTLWNTQYIDAANTSWASLWDIQNRTYDTWRKGARTPDGNYSTPQYVGMPAIMAWHEGGSPLPTRYWLIMFTEWGVGAYDQHNFAYDRYEIYPEVNFTKADYDNTAVDIISEGVHIKRDNNQALYNAINEDFYLEGLSPKNTKWNSIYTDSRPNYSGFTDLNNLESRVYTDFVGALDAAVGSNIIGTDLIMWDMTTDLYYKITFNSWTRGDAGGGFSYTRTVIPQSCPIKFADGTVLNTAPVASGGTACCPVTDANGNLIIDDNSDGLVRVTPGSVQTIPNFSGMLIVNDHYDGRVETWIAGGGDGVLISFSNVGAGPCNNTLTMNGGANGYDWTNVDNYVGPVTFTVIKTRNGS
jgi:hypothetical protein